jgi:hypothetical protein
MNGVHAQHPDCLSDTFLQTHTKTSNLTLCSNIENCIACYCEAGLVDCKCCGHDNTTSADRDLARIVIYCVIGLLGSIVLLIAYRVFRYYYCGGALMDDMRQAQQKLELAEKEKRAQGYNNGEDSYEWSDASIRTEAGPGAGPASAEPRHPPIAEAAAAASYRPHHRRDNSLLEEQQEVVDQARDMFRGEFSRKQVLRAAELCEFDLERLVLHLSARAQESDVSEYHQRGSGPG